MSAAQSGADGSAGNSAGSMFVVQPGVSCTPGVKLVRLRVTRKLAPAGRPPNSDAGTTCHWPAVLSMNSTRMPLLLTSMWPRSSNATLFGSGAAGRLRAVAVRMAPLGAMRQMELEVSVQK